MTSQRAEPTRVPPEVRAQLEMSLQLLAAAADFYDNLPAAYRARLEAMPEEQAHSQFVVSLGLLPPDLRARLLRCTIWLAEHVDEISPPQADPAPPAQPPPAATLLRLASSRGSEATG